MTSQEMQPSKSIEGLNTAIQELDGMYQDLRRRSLKLEDSLAVATFMDEDADYDIPRPAQGIINKPPTSFHQPMVDAEPIKSKQFNLVSQLESSSESDYSSGFGTLPNRNITPRSPLDYEFTPILEPQPPPFPVPDSDSDYDEPKSHLFDIYNHPMKTRRKSSASSDYAEPKFRTSDAVLYNSPMLVRSKSALSLSDNDELKSRSSDAEIYNYPISTKRKSSTCSSDYDEPKSRSSEADVNNSSMTDKRKPSAISSDYEEIEEYPPVANNRLQINTTTDTDYDQVYDVPTPRKDTFNKQQKSDVIETETNISDVDEMDKTENKNNQEDEASQPNDPIVNNVETTNFEFEEPLVAIVVNEVHANDVIDERTFPAAVTSNTKEPGRRHTFFKRGTSKIQEDGHTLPSSKNFLERIMDAAARRRKSGNKGPECPCTCQIAFPLMSAAVIICTVLFIIMVAGYVYIGIKTDERLEEAELLNSRKIFNSTDEVTGSGGAIA